MRRSSKILFSTIGMCLSVVTVFASFIPSTPEQRAKEWTNWMQTELQLSTAQIASVQQINLRYAQKTEDIKNKDGSHMAKFDELKANDKLKDADLKPILTKTQFELYQKKKKNKQREMFHAYRNDK